MPRHLHFYKGQAHTRGFLRGADGEVKFVFHASKGQRVSATARGEVIMFKLPNGEEAGDKSVAQDILIPETGDCLITISQNHMAEPEDHSFTLEVALHNADGAKHDR